MLLRLIYFTNAYGWLPTSTANDPGDSKDIRVVVFVVVGNTVHTVVIVKERTTDFVGESGGK